MEDPDKKYSTLKTIAVIYKILPWLTALAVIGAIIILAGKVADFKTFLIIDIGLVLFAIIAGITMSAVSELIKLFTANEQGIRRTNELLSELLDKISEHKE